MKKNLLLFIIIFLAINLVFNFFSRKQNDETGLKNEVIIKAADNEFAMGDIVTVNIHNNTPKTITIKNNCPDEPFEILYLENNVWTQKKHRAEITCGEAKDYVIKSGEKISVNYGSWNHALFGKLGRYKIRAGIAGLKVIETGEFKIKPQGVHKYLWITLFYQPLYNTLILLISLAPWHDLGLGILLLTILIRTILLIPSQNALKSQRRMQELQPKLNKLKEKYKDNQEKLASETFALYKEQKVNPLGSCLPLLIQFPILIALYYVVQDGLNPDNGYLLYSGLQNFTYSSINVNFLNILDLTKINSYILPLIVGGLQFLQMKLAVVRSAGAKNSAKETGQALQQVDRKVKSQAGEMEIANKMMLYFMPAMIAVFTASVPAGVGLYWCVSTVYGIGQQLVVNRTATSNITVKP